MVDKICIHCKVKYDKIMYSSLRQSVLNYTFPTTRSLRAYNDNNYYYIVERVSIKQKAITRYCFKYYLQRYKFTMHE